MSEAGQDWARLGAAAAQDAALASFAAGGALLLWDGASGRPGYANAAGRAMLGGDASGANLPAQTRQRFGLLASGLASRDGVRLERLRLTSGFAAIPVTCGCKLLVQDGGEPVLAIAIQASELRRLGITIPEPDAAPAASLPHLAAAAPSQETAPVAPRRATVRFLWQSDASGCFTSISPNIAELIGASGAAALPGRSWADVIGDELIDRAGGLAERLTTPATWSGHDVLWRTETPAEGARVELSGTPVLDTARQLLGFRGFGLARLTEREPFSVAPADGAAQPDIAETTAESADDAATEASDETVLSQTSLPMMPPAVVALAEPVDEHATTSEAAPFEVQALSVEPAQPDQELDEAPAPAPAANIVPIRNGQITSIRPVLEPSKPNLSSAERNAFREIAKALGARIAGDDEVVSPRLPPAAPLQLKEGVTAPAQEKPASTAPETTVQADIAETESKADAPAVFGRPRLPNSHADLLDKLPIAVLVNRGDEALYANRTLLDLLDYADLDDLTAGGGVSRLIKEAARSDGGAMILIDRRGHLISVDAVLSSVGWQGEPATLMAFRHPDGGGEVKVLTPEEAEEAELAAEFEAEDYESAARVEALRLDADAKEARIGELIAMLDTATDGVVTVDERGRILSLNKTAEALFGYDQREVTGELFTLLFAAESHAPGLDYLEGLKGGGVASVMNDGREVVGRVRQGGKIPLFMTMGQIAEGTERRFCAVLRDITAWKKTEGELVEARKAAEKASAQKSDVLAKISHEIRTPLNAIIGFAEVMAEERFGPIANERYKEYLRDIHQSGGYVISLVNDLLDLAKIEAGKLDLDFVSVNLNEIALSAVSLLQPEAQRGRVVLRSGLSPKLPPVVADQRSIRQIVINLLSNAVKFTDAGGQVIISTALGDQGEAILRVRDTGIGMDDKEIELALEPFRQVPTTRRAGGTGLGLPLTKALVEANRAAMSITSVKKEGTLVEITFPPQRVLAG